MVIKIKKEKDGVEQTFYKSSKRILTSLDKKRADEFDLELNKTIKRLENILVKSGILLKKGKKKDTLKVWYKVGETLNNFLNRFPVDKEDEDLFWNNLYGHSFSIHKGIPTTKISRTRNDFRTASLLAKYPMNIIKKVGPWAMWREILSYKNIMEDERILEWIIDELIKKQRTRDEARPILKIINARFKKMDTQILSDKELLIKLQEIKTTTGTKL